MVDVDEDARGLNLLPVNRRLAMHLLRIEADAPLLVFAKAVAEVKINAVHALPGVRECEPPQILGARTLRCEVHNTACRGRLVLRARTRKATIRSRDDVRALYHIHRRVELREHARHIVDVGTRPVRAESAVLEVVVQDAARRADRRRDREHTVERLRGITE